jgi:hypothetical protein
MHWNFAGSITDISYNRERNHRRASTRFLSIILVTFIYVKPAMVKDIELRSNQEGCVVKQRLGREIITSRLLTTAS